jgi:hypothetical protein
VCYNDENEKQVGARHDMTLLETLTERLRAIAEREGRSPEVVLQELRDGYEQRVSNQAPKDPLDDFIGAFDDDVTDLSTTVRETLHRKFTGHDRPA